MNNISIKKLLESKFIGKTILISSILLIYLLIALYFNNHFFFNTIINEVDVSLREYDDIDSLIRSYIKDYELQLTERNGEMEEIKGQDIGMKYNEKNSVFKIHHMQNSLKWISSLLKEQKYFVNDLYIYNRDALENEINELNCLNKEIIEPQNVSFEYSNGSYEVIAEVYGNKVNKEQLHKAIEMSLLVGKTKLDLNKNFCYENPRYTIKSDKTLKTKNLMNKYISTKIIYKFESEIEILDEKIIKEWINVDEDLEVVVNSKAVEEYVKGLSKKYDTVGIARRFKTSRGKIVEVKGGIYGWKINRTAETIALLENIKLGKVIEKEPIYSQKALFRDKDDIGNTYVEINITKQHLWFYKAGKLITQGAVVTGNPNKGYHTKVGTYMLNYKEKGSILRGPNYEAEVIYWMPFYGNIGIHDASWRYSFGREIYKNNGTHGCVNVPLYLAKRIYDNIEEGTPIIIYEE